MKRKPKWLTVLLTIGFTGLLAAGAGFYFVTQQPDSAITQKLIKPVVGFISGFKKFKNIDEAQPDFTLAAGALQTAFLNDAVQAKSTYEQKVVQVTGIISAIASPTDTNIVILLESDDPMSNVSCQMDPQFNARVKQLVAGAQVTIRGICNGSKGDDLLGSLDVLLNRCVVVQ